MKTVSLIVALAAGLVAGCANNDDRIAFDGKFFRAKVQKVEKQNDVFTVTVKGVSQSLNGAREAGRYEATDHCIQNYGTSKIIWRVGPDTPPEQLSIVDDTLTFSGRCPQR